MQITYAALTDVGVKREHNEDAFLVDADFDLFAVCDGMGGHAAGEVASSIAVQVLREAIEQNSDMLQSFRDGTAELERYEVIQILEHAIQTACDRIYEAAQQDDKKRGMGTTCSMLMIIGSRGFIGHVGDSRVYLIRDGMIHQLTEDHSLVNELVRRGKLKRGDAAGSPYAEYKNAVTRAVGVYPSVEGDTLDFDVLPGDQFMLCSDGLHFYLDDDKILEAFKKEDLEEVVKGFIELAREGGGHDNITSVAVRVAEEVADAEHEEKVAEISLTIEVLHQIPLFKYCTYKELVHIMNITEVRDYASGEKVFEEGSEGDYLFIVMKGKVKLEKGKTYITSFGAGTHFGEMALVDRLPRSGSATAEEDSRLLRIHRRDFYAIVRQEGGLSVRILWSFVQVLAERLRSTTLALCDALEEKPSDGPDPGPDPKVLNQD
ncbi:MAG: Stp1/IreP family PP2C-type Ser/Thr phosphatase [Polyangia bacterium]|jgi:serine/threonine protein phosphatase PrpC|nr:Stp1/IreP family PP2C-type Ser/Thr phosphatase [Polyangia bacterium]